MAKEKTFEEKMNELDDIMEKLEDESTSLDDSISYYSKGLDLIKNLQKTLKDYEKKIDEINK